MNVKIYVLIDPTTFKIRYIGRTKNSLRIRLNGHISKSKKENNHKSCWIRSLINSGFKPIIKLYKIVYGWKYSYEYEKKLINKCINNGFNLVNLYDRGIGGINRNISDETRKKISKTLKSGYKNKTILPPNTTKISLFDLNGNLLKKYSSCTECINEINIPRTIVEKLLAGSVKRWKSYQITYGKNPGKYIGRTKYDQNEKAVNLFCITNMKIKKFNSFKSLAKYLNVSSPTIRRYINKKYKNKYRITYAR